MQTFIVRLFDADDVDGFSGWIEEPLTGRRSVFHDPEELVASLRSARRPPVVGAPPATSADSDAVGPAIRQSPGRS
jgi:hypothetical protein